MIPFTHNNARELHPDAHASFRELLPEYAMARLCGGAAEHDWSALEGHIAGCGECDAELADLLQLLADTASGDLAAAADYPALDFAFISEQASEPAPTLGAGSALPASLERTGGRLREIVIQFTDSILQAMQAPQLAGSFRGPAPGSYQHPKQHTGDLHIAIDIVAAQPASACYRVVVTVVDPLNPFAQAGHAVLLRCGPDTQQQLSDHRGCVAFDNIAPEALPKLQFTIMPREPG